MLLVLCYISSISNMSRKAICNVFYVMQNIWKKIHMPIMSVTVVVEDRNESFQFTLIVFQNRL